MDVRDLIGNRFKFRSDVTLHVGAPESKQTETWESGRLSPIIQSWVEHDGKVWYQFGELTPHRYVQHDPDALKPVEYSGGAKHLRAARNGSATAASMDFSSTVNGFFDVFSVKNFRSLFVWVVGIIALIVGVKVYGFLK